MSERNNYEARLFPLQKMAEIAELYKQFAETMSRHFFEGGGAAYVPPLPPVRFSRARWLSKYNRVRWSLTAARRRVGLWIGGISPNELECDC